MLQAISHATAKAGMFMAAGLVYPALGHDRIDDLAGAARALPLTLLAFVLGGVALMGVLPSGAYLAKKLLLDATAATRQGWLEIVLNTGAFLTAGYTVLVLAHALCPATTPIKLKSPVSRIGEIAAFALALGSLLLGIVAAGIIPGASLSGALTPESLVSALILIVGGTAVACAIGLRLPPLAAAETVAAMLRPLRRMTVAAIELVVRVDGALRHWPVASIALLVLAIAIAAAIAAASVRPPTILAATLHGHPME